MDPATLHAYDAGAAAYAADWLAQPAPDDMYALLRDYFTPGPTADVGCGAGRDTAWLEANGFPAIGYDASAGLLATARSTYPNLTFAEAALPELTTVPPAHFQNVLCETVIMHLDPDDTAAATQRLIALLRPGGTLFLSWRVTAGISQRDGAGRLYAAFDASVVLDACAGHTIVLDREDVNVSSGKAVHRIILRS